MEKFWTVLRLLKIVVAVLTLTSAVKGQVGSTQAETAQTISDLRYVLGSNYSLLVAAYWRHMIASCELVSYKMANDLQTRNLNKFCVFMIPCPVVYPSQSCLVQVTALYINLACCPNIPFIEEATTVPSRVFTSPQPTCPYGPVLPDSKIYGGFEAEPGEFPWVVMLLRDGVFFCAGTIVDSTHVMTAAHCFKYFPESAVYEVLAGHHKFDISQSEVGDQRVAVKTIKVHENFNQNTYSNDIAMITLTSPLTITSYVTPACLPSVSDSLEPTCTVAGWGKTNGGKPPTVLMNVRLNAYNATECLKTFDQSKNLLDIQVANDMICAANGTFGGKDSCTGDSGGPLMCSKMTSDGSYRYFVFGIVSNGNGCAIPGEPGVYTNVARFLNWIKDNTINS
ncbi:trypsin-like [Biomphalaria glabrata]|uniref:Trypsin-like n=1 Tax=Biomphalaria glabrata TaxID=6526 RepID=A0A9W3AW98_BIOGL|nr:trypsin-like [Biomphalaria glabrata]XP_055891498.1 trypsin-like [Biomphalaria glabrata]XP_055891499.1 trypsin-like [Biomphalaria glabrata]XP_055891500.1 trypsin-like [Biomphalaria glabrata]KAI8762550.1 trypsin-1-like isoform X1 [Biomphalaria glabrata]